MDTMLLKGMEQYGLGVILALSILGIAWFLLKKVFLLIQNLIDVHFQSQSKAHEYQREEHTKIIEGINETCTILKSINGKTK